MMFGRKAQSLTPFIRRVLLILAATYLTAVIVLGLWSWLRTVY